jgi:hypothetical protein
MGSTGWFPLGPREIYRPEQGPAREGYVNQHIRGAVVVTTNQTTAPIPRERAPDAEVHNRPFRNNPPVQVRNLPFPPVAATPIAPARPIGPAEPPVRARVISPVAAPVQIQAPVQVIVPAPSGPFGLPHAERPREVDRGEQGRQRVHEADAPRPNTPRSSKELTPEEELLLRGKRKQ